MTSLTKASFLSSLYDVLPSSLVCEILAQGARGVQLEKEENCIFCVQSGVSRGWLGGGGAFTRDPPFCKGGG